MKKIIIVTAIVLGMFVSVGAKADVFSDEISAIDTLNYSHKHSTEGVNLKVQAKLRAIYKELARVAQKLADESNDQL